MQLTSLLSLAILIATVAPLCSGLLRVPTSIRRGSSAFGRLHLSAEGAEELSLKQRLTADMKQAMKAKEKERLAAVRGIQAAIKQKEVDDQKPATDDDVVAIMSKLLKQRKESIKSYSDSGRAELAAAEQYEYDVIISYMPKQMSAEEVQKIVDAAIAEVGASSVKDMGKVMGLVRPKLAGKADMAEVGNMIKTALNK